MTLAKRVDYELRLLSHAQRRRVPAGPGDESGQVIGAQASDQETSVQKATHPDADRQRDHAECHRANQDSQLDLLLVRGHTEFRRDQVDRPEPSVVADRKHDQDDERSFEDAKSHTVTVFVVLHDRNPWIRSSARPDLSSPGTYP